MLFAWIRVIRVICGVLALSFEDVQGLNAEC